MAPVITPDKPAEPLQWGLNPRELQNRNCTDGFGRSGGRDDTWLHHTAPERLLPGALPMAVVWGSPDEIRWNLPGRRLSRLRLIRLCILALILIFVIAYEFFPGRNASFFQPTEQTSSIVR
jgi:hypothetical protein